MIEYVAIPPKPAIVVKMDMSTKDSLQVTCEDYLKHIMFPENKDTDSGWSKIDPEIQDALIKQCVAKNEQSAQK